MMLHGAGSNHRLALRRVFGKSNAEGETDVEATRNFPEWDDVDFIVATPYARGTAGYQGIPEQDVYDVLADVKKRLNVDENRTYLTGLSMGGGGTLWIGLTRPDIWAAIAPVCPAPPEGTIDLAVNALNYPVHFFHGDADPVVPVAGTQKWVALMQDLGIEVSYKEFVDVKHDSWVSAYDAEFIFEWFKPIERVPFPNRVRFVSRQLKYNKAYWIELNQIASGAQAEIDAKFTKENILGITTTNLEAFTLRLSGHPKFNPSGKLTLTVDGIAVPILADSVFYLTKKNNTWSVAGAPSPETKISKKKGLEGPVFDAFSTRHIYVYGTAGNPTPEELKGRIDDATKAASWSVYRGEFLGRVMFFPRVVADKDVRPSDIETSNLILFGTKETNTIIASHATKLPVHLNPSAVKSHGLFYVFPEGNHYVAVSSGLPWWTGLKDEGFPFVPAAFRGLAKFQDLILFKESVSTNIAQGYFTNDWKLSEPVKSALMKSGVVNIQK